LPGAQIAKLESFRQSQIEKYPVALRIFSRKFFEIASRDFNCVDEKQFQR